jgi:DNA-binding NtrC family response regulator
MPRILFIDDEEDIIIFTRKYFERKGFEVSIAINSKDAMEILSKEKVDLVFCDMNIEHETSGLAILAECKKINPGLNVYLCTGFEFDNAMEEKAANLGVKEILHKPLTYAILEEKVKAVLPFPEKSA